MKILIYFLIISLLCLGSTCKKDDENDYHKIIKFINNSNMELYVQQSGGYPDTTFARGEFPNPILSELNRILPNETNTMALEARYSYEEKFKYSYDTLMIFILNSQVLKTTPWEKVQQDYLVLKRYDLGLEDLKRMNWTITYP